MTRIAFAVAVLISFLNTVWMRSIPGADNGPTYKGRPLTNWWVYMGDYDLAVAKKVGLVNAGR